MQLEIGNALAGFADARVADPKRPLAHRQCALIQRERFAELSARGARIAQVLERRSDGDVIGRQALLTNLERTPIQFFSRRIVAETLPHHGEPREHGCDLGMLLALYALDVQQAHEKRFRAREGRLPEEEPAQLIECDHDRRLVRGDMPFAHGQRLREQMLCLCGLPEFLLERAETNEDVGVLAMHLGLGARGFDRSAQCLFGGCTIAASGRQARGLQLLLVFLVCIRHSCTFRRPRWPFPSAKELAQLWTDCGAPQGTMTTTRAGSRIPVSRVGSKLAAADARRLRNG